MLKHRHSAPPPPRWPPLQFPGTRTRRSGIIPEPPVTPRPHPGRHPRPRCQRLSVVLHPLWGETAPRHSGPPGTLAAAALFRGKMAPLQPPLSAPAAARPPPPPSRCALPTPLRCPPLPGPAPLRPPPARGSPRRGAALRGPGGAGCAGRAAAPPSRRAGGAAPAAGTRPAGAAAAAAPEPPPGAAMVSWIISRLVV